jgi:glycosyltransferase involved in cell wall biosynthesis
LTRRFSGEVPAEVEAAAEARAAAREARDWTTADRLRGEIEAAGWKVVDTGAAFHLEPAHPPDVVLGDAIRYGRSDAVPSLLGTPPTRPATVIVVAREDIEGAARAAHSLLAHLAHDQLVVVADGLPDRSVHVIEAAVPAADLPAAAGPRLEIVRTSAVLGQGASLNAGLRRASGRVVVVVDPSIEATGDVVGPLVAALEDPRVAIAGPLGLVSPDLRHYTQADTTGPAAAIEGSVMAFRREDVERLGPLDEAFRFDRYLDAWWSLVLRDAGPESAPREARVVAGLPLTRHERLAWRGTPAAERDRQSKRNFYRLLARFRDRPDLAVGGT